MLKNCYRQYQQYAKVQTMLKNNWISLVGYRFSWMQTAFLAALPVRMVARNGLDFFVAVFWHCECVCELSEKVLQPSTRSGAKNMAIISARKCDWISTLPLGPAMLKLKQQNFLLEQAVSQIRSTSAALAALKQEMQKLASALPECLVVMKMFGARPNAWTTAYS